MIGLLIHNMYRGGRQGFLLHLIPCTCEVETSTRGGVVTSF